jgi:hypothetical protein
MRTRNAMISGFSAAIFVTLALGGCAKGVKSFAPVVDPEEAAEAAVKQYDTNKDGILSGRELEGAASLNSNLEKIDQNGDRALTVDEIAARIRYLQSAKQIYSRTPIRCTVFRNKELLADAEVRLVPERFLGPNVKAAKGKASFNGVAVLYTENPEPGEPRGVAPGFYKVEITKAGEKIPPKYNTNTILGIDTSMDNPEFYKGVRFVMEYEVEKKPPRGMALP